MNSLPLVTIGVPVYNEAKYIAAALDSLFAQTYPHTEIIIADNASTDGTSEICAEYAVKHSNIRHIRHPRNIGQSQNFNYLPRCASGTYFHWAAGHDLWDPNFLEETVRVLEQIPQAVLAFTRSVYITHDGTHAREESRPFDITQMSPAGRFLETMWRVDCNCVYGVFRAAAMRESKLFQIIPAADRVFLAEMAAKGPFVSVPVVRQSRWNRETRQTEIEKRHRIMAYLFPGRTFTDAAIAGNDFYVPMQRAFYRAAQDAGFPFLTRLRAYVSIWFSGVLKYHLFPGADMLSRIVKVVLPRPILAMILRRMQ